MKENQFADVYGASLQRELDNDMRDLATEMVTGRAYGSGKKVVPNYEETDIFKRQAYETQSRLTRQAGKDDITRNLIQPNDPNKPRIMVVLPNE